LETISKEQKTLILKSKRRVKRILNGSLIYTRLPVPRSTKFLRAHISEKHSMFVLFVDMVGSTKLSSKLPPDVLSLLIRIFCQEMAVIIEHYNGYVLKFVGDAAIGYFMIHSKSNVTANQVVNCAKTMILVIEDAINSVFSEFDFPELKVKIGIDYGIGTIVLYSSNKQLAHIDIIGLTLNLAAKMQSISKPNQIVIGETVHSRLPTKTKKTFRKLDVDTSKWHYEFEGKKTYPIFANV
jgi:class 3 adenylate cyclase